MTTQDEEAAESRRTVPFYVRIRKALWKTSRKVDPWGPLIPESVNQYAEGYPQLAARRNVDVNLRITRRFGYLHERVLLRYQDRLAELEGGLQRIDAFETESYRLKSRRHDEGPQGNPLRTGLLNEITSTLKEYDEFILRANAISKLESPRKRSLRNLLTWMWNEKPIRREEHEVLYRENDLLTLNPDDDAWIINTAKRIFGMIPWRIKRWLFPNPEDENGVVWSDAGMAMLIKFLLAFVSVCLLMLPTFVLLNINVSPSTKAAVVALFALGFAASISLFTNVKRHEVFAVIAAYCAVLVVFLSALPSRG